MMMTSDQMLALLPLLVISATAVMTMLAIAIKRSHWWNSTITVLGLNLALLAVGYVATHPHEAMVTPLLTIDPYACLYMALILVSTLACATLAHGYLSGFPGNKEEFYLLLTLSCAGGMVLVCSRHLAGLFIGLELLSVPVYGMVAYPFRENRSLEAGIKYMVLSAAASAFLLFGMALLYAQAGTLSFEGLGARLAGESLENPLVLAGVALMIAGIGFKLSIAPFHLWTPDVYQGAPAPVGAYLATASKVAVFAVLMRLLISSPAMHDGLLFKVFSVLAILSIMLGNLLALTQTNLKRLLGYSSIAHFGYIMVAVVAASPLAFEAVSVYLITYVVTTLGAFGVVSLLSSPFQGPDADELYDYRGLFWRRPYLTAVMTLMMLSLAGIPVTAGFIGKFYVAAAGVGAKLWWPLAALVVGSALGLYYYLRVMIIMYLPKQGMVRFDAPLNWGQRTGGLMIIAMTVLMLILGMYPQPILDAVHQASMFVPQTTASN